MNLCASCGLDFASVDAFDRHRVGIFPQTGPAEYRDRVSRGLVDWAEEWEPKSGRRCLDPDEMGAVGLELDGRGRWRVAEAAARIAEYRQNTASELGIPILRAA